MISRPDRAPGIERQRTRIETSFRNGWRPPGAGEPRALTDRAYAEARKILDHGGWTGLDQATIQAVRDGAQPGDPLPPLQPDPYIDNVTNTEVIITGHGARRRVAVLFSHQNFPGTRFGHRFPLDPDGEDDGKIGLKEDIETGALDRMMNHPPAPDDAGTVWTNWRSPGPD